MRGVIVIGLALASVAAWAQPKPALVQQRDEPARQPWSWSFEVTVSTLACGTPLVGCQFSALAVPAGKRLVVTHASVAFSATDPEHALAYTGPNPYPDMGHVVPLTLVGTTRLAGGGPTLYYVEAGNFPYVRFSAAALTPGRIALVALSGYLIDVP